MKRSKGKRAQPPKKNAPVANTYFRLCHVCFHLNEASEPIVKCEVCDNDYANLFLKDFYANEGEDDDASTDQSAEGEASVRKENLVILRRAITGLSVVW